MSICHRCNETVQYEVEENDILIYLVERLYNRKF